MDTIYHWIALVKNMYLWIMVSLFILIALKSLAGKR